MSPKLYVFEMSHFRQASKRVHNPSYSKKCSKKKMKKKYKFFCSTLPFFLTNVTNNKSTNLSLKRTPQANQILSVYPISQTRQNQMKVHTKVQNRIGISFSVSFKGLKNDQYKRIKICKSLLIVNYVQKYFKNYEKYRKK